MLWYKSWLRNPLALSHRSGAAGALRARCRGRLSAGDAAAAAGPDDRCRRRDRPADQRSGGTGAQLPRLRVVAVASPEHDADVDAVCGAARHRRPALAGGRKAARCSPCRCRSPATACSAFGRQPGWPNCSCSPSSRRLLLPLLSPAVGQTYGVGDALAHGVCLFMAGAVVFSLAFLLSTVFSDVWRPALIAGGAAAVLAICEPFFPGLSRYSLFGIMSGEVYFRGGGLPWAGLLGSAAAAAAIALRRDEKHRASGFLTRAGQTKETEDACFHANDPRRRTAAAAGACLSLRRQSIRRGTGKARSRRPTARSVSRSTWRRTRWESSPAR